MGNCINHLFSPAENTEVLMHEGEKGFRASISKPTKEVPCHGYELNHYSLPHSLLPPGTEPGPGVVGCLRRQLMQPPKLHSISLKIVGKESCQGRSIKILVSRQQLEFLLGESMKRSSGTFQRGNRKWRPSLASIPEVSDF